MNNDTRPINLDLTKFAWPVTAIASIMHRIAGVVLFAGMVFLLYALDMSLDSEESFELLKSTMSTPLGKFMTWGVLSALGYHIVAGFKHYLMDLGFAETFEGAIIAARTTLLLSVILIGLLAVWVF